MQMDAESKKQNGTLFVWWGHWKGGLGGGWSLRGVHPKKYTHPKNLLVGRKYNTLAIRGL